MPEWLIADHQAHQLIDDYAAVGETQLAHESYEHAIELSENEQEREFLRDKMRWLAAKSV